MSRVPGNELRPEHFDGHTEFASMDAEQRLIWLSEIARFVHEARVWRSPGERANPGSLGLE